MWFADRPVAAAGVAACLQANFTDVSDHRSHAESPCLAPFVRMLAPVNAHTPPPVLVIIVLLVTLPLANLPSIRLLARLNTVGGAHPPARMREFGLSLVRTIAPPPTHAHGCS